MIEIVKAGTKYPFIPNAKRFLFVSLMVVLSSAMLLATRGLNLGIDFKGGNKVIVAIQDDAGANMDKIKATIASLIEAKTGEQAGQIEVQSFDLGETEGAEKFQIYTELTSLLKEEKATAVNDKLAATLKTESIERPTETDKFIIVLKSPAPVNATKDSIATMLKDLGFLRAEIVSEEERALDMEFYKDYNLSLVERQKEGREIPEDDFEKALASHENKKRKSLDSRTDRTYTISLQQLQQDVESSLTEAFGKDKVEVESSTSVSPSVGADLFNKGLLAMIYAIIGILIYIGLRFDFRYSPGAVVALIHDTMITLGIFALFGIKFTLPIISALLTIIGYSLNDTIVVYDRIRENLTKFRGMDLAKLVNQSVNETLSRTLLTSVTTLFVVLALLFLGGGLISDFALALTIGVIVGTYSSIFVASPMVIYIDGYLADRKDRAQKAAPAAA
ncbi:MAG: protein translocase subunit SecF [Myxococcota bacterium]|nr:protein translocase subunit SecF [Myxococcota bacterium]